MSLLPTVSVIATAFNHEKYVQECLDAIAGQTFDDFELVIMDDCSTDGSVARIQEWLDRTGFTARLIANEQNRGICATRNIALAHCQGEFVSFVSGDDYYEPNKLEAQVAAFSALDESFAVVFANAAVIAEDGSFSHHWFEQGDTVPDGRIFDRLLEGNYVPAPTVMVRRSALDAVGPYDESLYYEDFDMWLRLADRYQFNYVPQALVAKRELGTSMSSNTGRMRSSRVAVLLKWRGRSEHSDAVIARRVWSQGRRLLVSDPATGLAALRAADELAPSPRRRVFIALAPWKVTRLSLSVAIRFRDITMSWVARARRS
jgi:glycosyltransferase involved in cell wall biosynthesis